MAYWNLKLRKGLPHNVLRRLVVALGVALLLSPFFITAQTHKQKGVVRKITNSAQSPIVPVKNVKVMVGNRVSKPTSPDGRFTMDVPKEFEITGVSAAEQYILALPTKGKKFVHSANDVDVIVTTKAEQQTNYKKLYQQIRAAYYAQADTLAALKQRYKELLGGLDSRSGEYQKVKHMLDSVQQLYLSYITNEESIEEKIKEIAEELSLTDYISLDSLD